MYYGVNFKICNSIGMTFHCHSLEVVCHEYSDGTGFFYQILAEGTTEDCGYVSDDRICLTVNDKLSFHTPEETFDTLRIIQNKYPMYSESRRNYIVDLAPEYSL